MEFGKVAVEQLDQIDLNLPPDDPRNGMILGRAATARDARRIGIGAPVWGAKAWLGQVYPLSTPPTEFLHHYSRQFNSVELNTTHYRIPDTKTIAAWRDATPDTFRFCPKFPQSISHRLPLSSHAPLLKEFVASVMGLQSRLGLSLLQLPPHFSPTDLADLAGFLKLLPRDFPLAVEVRHPAFFTDHRLTEKYFDLLATASTTAVITDVAGRRDVLHSTLTSSRAFVRFIGNDLHPTDDLRARAWIDRIKHWLSLGLKELEFFIHEPGDTSAPELISRFITEFNSSCGLSIANWTAQDTGKQLGFF